jgi:hypothetical protein
MSQESFVLVKDLNFNDANVQAKAGDVLVFTPPEKLVVYRAGDIIGRIGFHKVSLDGLVLSGILLTEKKAKAQAAAPKVAITPDPGTEDVIIVPPVEKPKVAEPVVVKTEEPVNEQVVDTTTAAATQEGPADEAPVVEAPKVEEPKAEKPATKPAAKAAEPAKKPTKK